MAENLGINRKNLAAFIPDIETIRRFEKLFQVVGDLDPQTFAVVFRLIQELSIDIGTTTGAANSIRDSLASLLNDLDSQVGGPVPDAASLDIFGRIAQALNAHSGTVDARSVQALSDISALSRSVEAIPGDTAAIDAIHALARLLEVSASAPHSVIPRSLSFDYLDFDQAAPFIPQVARVGWSQADDTLTIQHSDGVTQQVGQELFGRITNNTGSAIPNGTAIGINPATNSFVLFIANGTIPPVTIVGVTTQAIANGAQGRITVWGRVRDIDTTGAPYGEVWAAGQILYVSSTIAGGFTRVKPTAPALSIPIAQVISVSSTTGQIAIRPVVEQQLFYGSFTRNTDQSATINTATAIGFDTTESSSGVSTGTPTSRIVAANAGLYKFSTSFRATCTALATANAYFWIRKNGVDVPRSCAVVSFSALGDIATSSRAYQVSLKAGEYVELMFAVTNAAVILRAVPATAFAPASPAISLSVDQIQQ